MSLRSTQHPLVFTGERLGADYLVQGDAAEARRRLDALCVEQTVEFPADLIERADILGQVLGQLEQMQPAGPDAWRARVSFATETAGPELLQLLNLLFGNISLQPGLRLVGLDLPASLLAAFPGPRFGVAGLRAGLGVHDRPLLCSALKPMGLSPRELAAQARALVRGGVDLLKDDHGLSDQRFCPFEERVARAAEAVREEAERRGRPCLYLANVTGPAETLWRRAHYARDWGAGGFLLAPGLQGFDSLRALSADPDLGLPVLAHPAFLGSLGLNPQQGLAPSLLYGTLQRLAGADGSVFPSYGGRFSFSAEDCGAIAAACRAPLGALPAIAPVPAGGMTLERVPELRRFYGDDSILLIGGDLHRHGAGLEQGCRAFVESLS